MSNSIPTEKSNERYTLSHVALHWWAILIAVVTFVLLCSGGLVTSKGVGMSVPDWPTTYGYNMFLFPVSKWVGGIFYEHSHRLLGSLVGFLVLTYTIACFILDKRSWMKTFAVCLLIGVIIQGLLGGFRVVLNRNDIGIIHALVAQSFFAACALLCVVTSRPFFEHKWADYDLNPAPRRLALFATALIFLQLLIGATMRHEHIGLSIPDFPLAYGSLIPDTSPETMAKINLARVDAGLMQITAEHVWVHMAHRLMALVIFGSVLAFFLASRKAPRAIRFWSTAWLGLIMVQIALGAWTVWSQKAADVATAHMALGALLLVLGVVVSFRLILGAKAENFRLPDVSGQPSVQGFA